MSVSLWAYTPECDGQPCPQDCDRCPKRDEAEQAALEQLYGTEDRQ